MPGTKRKLGTAIRTKIVAYVNSDTSFRNGMGGIRKISWKKSRVCRCVIKGVTDSYCFKY